MPQSLMEPTEKVIKLMDVNDFAMAASAASSAAAAAAAALPNRLFFCTLTKIYEFLSVTCPLRLWAALSFEYFKCIKIYLPFSTYSFHIHFDRFFQFFPFFHFDRLVVDCE